MEELSGLKANIKSESRNFPLAEPEYSNKDNAVYTNGLQDTVLNVLANTAGVRGGRGTGKTNCISGVIVNGAQRAVRSCQVLYGSSYAQIYGRTMPAMIKDIESTWHWVEGVHFFRGQAPRSANFPQPLARPKSWSNCIHWYTGAITQLCSSAVKGSTNGLSIQQFVCLTADSKILTNKGYKCIVDINVGDLVLTKSRTWQRVARKFNNGVHDTCTIKASGIEDIHCTYIHRFWILRKGCSEPEFVEAKDIREGDCFLQHTTLEHNQGWDVIYYQGLSYYAKPFESISYNECAEVYNIEVCNDHSYVVSGCISKNCDETRYVNWDAIAEEVRPAIRPTVYDGGDGWKLKKNSLLCSQFYVSDAAISNTQARWEKIIADEAAECSEINDQIAEMLAELEVAAQEGWYYDLYNNPVFKDKLNYLRSQSTHFFNFSTVENLEVLGGEAYLRKLMRQLPPLIFNIQIMNGTKGLSKKDSYYASFSEDVHCYDPNQTLEEDLIKGKFNKKFQSRVDIGGMSKKVEWEAPDLLDVQLASEDCSLDVDCIDGLPLYITLDTNKNINTFCVAQRYKMLGLDSLVFLKSLYVLNERRLRSLCSDFHRYYAPHQSSCKDIFFGYDSTNKASNYALEEQDELKFYNVVRDELSRRGWKVYLVDMGSPMEHGMKYQLMNDAFSGGLPFVIRINKYKNDFLIASLNTTKVRVSMGVCKKDKSREKLSRTLDANDLPANQISDMSDAFDNMVLLHRYHYEGQKTGWGVIGVPVSGVIIM